VGEVTFTEIVQLAWASVSAAPVTAIEVPPAVAVMPAVPLGQLDTRAFGVAITSPAGRLSVNAMPDCAGLPAPLVIVKVSVEMPPWSIVSGENALPSEACETVSGAGGGAAGERHRPGGGDRAAGVGVRPRRGGGHVDGHGTGPAHRDRPAGERERRVVGRGGEGRRAAVGRGHRGRCGDTHRARQRRQCIGERHARERLGVARGVGDREGERARAAGPMVVGAKTLENVGGA
jgi:hypothetical protein